jgi:hypothetical protein
MQIAEAKFPHFPRRYPSNLAIFAVSSQNDTFTTSKFEIPGSV